VWSFYLPDDAVIGFIITNITSVLMGILVTMKKVMGVVYVLLEVALEDGGYCDHVLWRLTLFENSTCTLTFLLHKNN
jgi:hypothetical protein